MRISGILALLFFVVATAAIGQIPRTISYQGRASDATGPVTGSRQMTLVIYSAQSGGTPLFQEVQTVTFATGGVFTVGIGAATAGGIPTTVLFDKPYYLGVKISGFNGGAELSPRYTLRSVPYSLRSEESEYANFSGEADSALAAHLADSTKRIPFVIGGNTNRTRVGYIDIVDSTKTTGVALKLKGDRYALISEGVDSSSSYFVSGSTLGPATAPVAGALYRDNVPMAWGVVESDGSLISNFGIKSVTKMNDSSYEVTLNTMPQGVSRGGFVVPDISPVITMGGYNIQGFYVPSWVYKRGPTGYERQVFIVRIRDIEGFNVSTPFSIQVFGRGQ
jgi:hypothetical protein